ncbi:FG-GAP repeat domain-containing protein [Puniceibacterium confluentis]|uniref:FG-GAP repeat domain-containing protein n=1 Tax=Puniceibacterium confluentis TaxID=1958944 RepID=UPI001FE5406D|nr:VCBS repeat-containing protein [Puniceibacterium confluentis]
MLGACGAVRAEIVAARYLAPTERYDHGVLGDAVEWGGLELSLDDGRVLRAILPETLVFEDIAPRLADVDGDGAPEVLVVETSLTQGARLAVWGEQGRIAATPHIGQRNRWLAPLGAADLDGDGRIEIAYIDRPHLARTLRLWRLEQGALSPVAELGGLTNHRIGWDYILGGIRGCGGSAEIIAANADWTAVMAVRFSDGRLEARRLGPYRSRQSIDAALACR